jgi:molybdopterin synthase catalytic subunit
VASGLTDAPIDLAALLAEVADPACGAVVVFVGRVRDRHAGRAVTSIEYSAYRPLAERTLATIVAELAAAHGARLAAVHRLGELGVGEASVAIAAAAPRRDAAFAASRAVLERIKRELPVWKRERYADGTSAWREEEPLAGPGGGAARP